MNAAQVSAIKRYALLFTIEIAKYTDINTAAATAGAAMFLLGQGSTQDNAERKILMRKNVGEVLEGAIGLDNLNKVADAMSDHYEIDIDLNALADGQGWRP